MSVPDTVRHGAVQVILEQYVCLGYNYRMTDVQAAIGLEQMKKLDAIVRRRELAARYTERLCGHPWLLPPEQPDYAECNYQSYAVRLADDAPVDRDTLMQRLLDVGIATRRGIMLAHLEPPYRVQGARPDLPASEAASSRSLLLPLYPDLTAEEQDYVIEQLYKDAGSADARPKETSRGAR
jgi:dTDP-4-amino-4,6-dideoxygalactose transaminase